MKKTLHDLILKATKNLYANRYTEALQHFQIEQTKDSKHGDYACNIALVTAKHIGKPPRDIAQNIVNHLHEHADQTPWITNIEIAGPGFINFTLSLSARYDILKEISHKKEHFGHSTIGHQTKILLEFISSNPTGPLHVGHGRSAAIGSALASLLRTAGFHVDCEYYINDAGRQMDILAVSVWLRYLALNHPTAFPFPDNAYQGDYVNNIANAWYNQIQKRDVCHINTLFKDLPLDEKDSGDKEIYIDAMIEKARELIGNEAFNELSVFACDAIMKDMKNDLEAFGVHYESWFSEKSLFTSGALKQSIEYLKKSGHTEEKEGALWFKSTDFGDDKDRVVIRANGKSTYFASDIAYHWNKYQRGYTQLINILGADHHGYIARLQAVVQALGKDPKALETLMVQFAILYRGKEKIPMSTRAGSFVTLRQLREEVGNDATRFFYIQRKSDQHLDFDLELAKSKSNENPVYYIQYAYARICSIFKQLAEKKQPFNLEQGLKAVELLTTELELQLAKTLSAYPELIETAALAREPHQIAHYLRELANFFHSYYNACIFLTDDEHLRNARLCLIMAVKQVLKNGLTILGVSTPEYM
jgi:arginyl-tRNA synthetase